MPDREMNLTTDSQALSSYAVSGDERKFTEFVERNLGGVYATALRCTGGHAMAEDVTQRVFAIAARKAKRLGQHPRIAGWLHRTAIYESKKCLSSERRHQRKLAAFAMHQETLRQDHSERDGVLPILDEAISKLPEPDRLIILARFFESKSVREIAGELGKSVEACHKQGQRALAKLASHLARRGIAVSTTTLAALLASPPSSALPVGIAVSVSKAALGNAGQLTQIHLLANSLCHMSYPKILTASVALVVAAIPITFQANQLAWESTELTRLEAQRKTLVEERNGGLGTDSQTSPVPQAAALDNLPSRVMVDVSGDDDSRLTPQSLIDLALRKETSVNPEIADMEYMRALTQLAQWSADEIDGLVKGIHAIPGGNSPAKRKLEEQLVNLLLAPKDPEAALAFAAEAGLGESVWRRSLQLWAERAPDDAGEWMEAELDRGLNSPRLAEDLEGALVEGFAAGLAKVQLEDAFKLLEGVDPSSTVRAVMGIGRELARQERHADFLRLANGLESPSDTLEALLSYNRSFRDDVRGEHLRNLLEMEGFPNRFRDDVIVDAALRHPAESPPAALETLAPNGDHRAELLSGLITRWAEEDPSAAAEWFISDASEDDRRTISERAGQGETAWRENWLHATKDPEQRQALTIRLQSKL